MSKRYPGGLITKNPNINPTPEGGASGIWTLDQAILYQKLGIWPSPTDPFFNQTTLLLHGDGTNGAQNNTFIDSSSNNFTITRNGNTTQGTFTPFSLPNGEWSNYFDGNGDYLSLADNAALEIGASSFCIEAWVYLDALPGSGSTYTVLGKWASGQVSYIFQINNNSGTMRLNLSFSADGTSATDLFQNASITANTWHHIAVTRDTTTVRFFLNGTQQGSTQTANATFYNGTSDVNIGRNQAGNTNFIKGYISNSRLVIGSAVYTSNFTPSTSPLTAISNTSLLTCQSNRFVDNSTNNFAITRNGDVSVQPFSPFKPSSAYSTSVNGGSGYFDGSGDKLVLPDNAAFAQNTDFTLEGWMYPLDNSANMYLYYMLANGSLAVGYYTDKKVKVDAPFVGIQITSSGTFEPNQWLHIAMSRISGTTTLYVNGVSQGTTGFTTTSTTNATNEVGATTKGYISDYRYVKGTGIYTGAFTPPTAPLTAVTNTQALLNFTNAGIFDNTGKNNLETVGNAQIDTTVKKWGTGSLEFDGNGDRLVTLVTPTTTLGGGNFTVECWLYKNANTAYMTLCGNFAVPSENTWQILGDVNGTKISWFNGASNSFTLTGGTTLNTGTWYHIAFVRSGSTLTLYVNGTSDGTATLTTNYDNISRLFFVGQTPELSAGRDWNGFIDDLRITKGIARYTANFTPPGGPFQNV